MEEDLFAGAVKVRDLEIGQWIVQDGESQKVANILVAEDGRHQIWLEGAPVPVVMMGAEFATVVEDDEEW